MSACLLGRRCRYDGDSRASTEVARALEGREVVAVCPEELGGLGTPRPAAELVEGDGHAVLRGEAQVLRVADRRDVTAAFVRGATLAAHLGEGATEAILKARSPSCGVAVDGVFAALLRERGIKLRTEETL